MNAWSLYIQVRLPGLEALYHLMPGAGNINISHVFDKIIVIPVDFSIIRTQRPEGFIMMRFSLSLGKLNTL